MGKQLSCLVCLLCRDTSCFSESFHGLLNQLRIDQICLLGEGHLFLELVNASFIFCALFNRFFSDLLEVL